MAGQLTATMSVYGDVDWTDESGIRTLVEGCLVAEKFSALPSVASLAAAACGREAEPPLRRARVRGGYHTVDLR